MVAPVIALHTSSRRGNSTLFLKNKTPPAYSDADAKHRHGHFSPLFLQMNHGNLGWVACAYKRSTITALSRQRGEKKNLENTEQRSVVVCYQVVV